MFLEHKEELGKNQNSPAWLLSCPLAGWSWWSVSHTCLCDGLGPGACYHTGLIAIVVGTKMPAAKWAVEQGNPAPVPDRPTGVASTAGTEIGQEVGQEMEQGG